MSKLPGTGAAQFGGIFSAGRFSQSRALEESPAFEENLGSALGRLGRWVFKRSGVSYFSGVFHAMAYLLRSLHGRFDWRGRPLKRGLIAAKYIVRTLSMPRQHVSHLSFIYGNRRLDAYRCRDPRLLERHFHRYMHVQWNRQARLQSIRQHYRFALTELPSLLFEAIYIYGNATLGYLTLKDGSQLKICLQPPIFLGCEGELCLQLSDVRDRPLYRIVFSVIDADPTIAIGCLQGPDGAEAKDTVRDLTRNMYGMRPKQLMLSLVYAFARHHGIERIVAVGNAAHPLRRARSVFQADYDAFWLEQKGHDGGDGWFVLPGMPIRKTEADVASNHRSAFRRREALRIEAEQLLTATLEIFPVHRVKTVPAYELESLESSPCDRLEASWIH